MDFPKRKNLRLAEYDYNQNGAYFLTICTHERKTILSDVLVGAIHESPVCRLRTFGSTVKLVLDEIPKRYGVEITDYVIMPNHVHMIVWINGGSGERAIRESPLRQNRSLISQIVGYPKMNASKRIREISPGELVWQRGYYDHVIRNYDDYLRIAEYIQNNPAKWREDELYRAE